MKKIILFILLLGVISCKKSQVSDIKIGNTLTENQSYSQNKILITLIEQVIKGNTKALSQLIKFDCGSSSGCYDLGSVITQIIVKIGESKFLVMAKQLDKNDISTLKGFISVGLEYGIPIRKNKTNQYVDIEFPLIYKEL